MYRSCRKKTFEAFKSSSRVRRKKERKGKRLRPLSSVLLVLRAVLYPAENVAFSTPLSVGKAEGEGEGNGDQVVGVSEGHA